MPKQVQIEVVAQANQAIATFGKIITTLNSCQRDINSLGKAGVDATKVLDRIADKGTEEMRDFARSAAAAQMTVEELKKKLTAMNKEAVDSAKAAKAAALEEAQSLAILQQREIDRQKNVADGLTKLGGKFKEVAADWRNAGADLATLQRQMQQAFGDKDLAANAVSSIRQLDDEVGLSEQSLAQASINLNKFGAFSEQNLTIAAVAAKKAGLSVEEVASAIGKFQKFGDAKAQMQLKKLLGLDDAEILNAGGVIEAIGAKFGTTTDGMTSASVKLKGELEEIKQDLGIEIVKAAGAANQALLPFVQSLHGAITAFGKFSPETMQAAGAVMFASTAVAGITSAIGMWQLAQTTLTEMQLASIGSTARWTAGVTAATAAIVLYLEAQQALAKAEKDRAELEGKQADDRIASLKAEGAWAGQTADELKKAGVTREQLLQAEAGSRDRMRQLQQSGGDKNEIQRLYDQAEAWHAMAVEMGTSAKAADDARAAANKMLESSQEKYKQYQADVQLGHYKTKQAQIDALQEVEVALLNSLGKMGDAERKAANDLINSLNIAIHRLGGEAAGEAATKAKKATDDKLKAALSALEVEEKTGKVNHAQAIERLKQLMQMHGLSADQRQMLERKIADEQGKIHAKQAEADKRREDAAKKIEEATRKRQAAEEDIQAKIRQLEGETTADRLREVQKQADAYAAAGVARADIDKFQSLSRRQIERSDAEKKLQEAKSVSDAEAQLGRDKEESLREELAQGKDVSAQLQALINERYQREEEFIRRRAELEAGGPEGKDAERKANAEIAHMENQRAKELRDLVKAREDENKKLDETKKKLEDLQKQKSFRGGGMSVAEAFGDGSTFGFSLDTGILPGGGGTGGGPSTPGAGATGTATAAPGPSAPATASSGAGGSGGGGGTRTAAAASAGDPNDRSTWKAQKEAATIGGDPSAALNKIIELLSLIADRLREGNGGGTSSATAASGSSVASLGMALGRDAFFSKGR